MVADWPRLVGDDALVPLVGGDWTRPIDLDSAASTPPMCEVADRVAQFLPWYSSVHRGAGWKSVVSSQLYENARASVARFAGARRDDVAVFTTNTTGALNLLS